MMFKYTAHTKPKNIDMFDTMERFVCVNTLLFRNTVTLVGISRTGSPLRHDDNVTCKGTVKI